MTEERKLNKIITNQIMYLKKYLGFYQSRINEKERYTKFEGINIFV